MTETIRTIPATPTVVLDVRSSVELSLDLLCLDSVDVSTVSSFWMLSMMVSSS